MPETENEKPGDKKADGAPIVKLRGVSKTYTRGGEAVPCGSCRSRGSLGSLGFLGSNQPGAEGPL